MRKLITIIALLAAALMLAVPALAQEQPAGMNPPPAGQPPRGCLDCHHLPNLNSNEGIAANQALCLECHSQKTCTKDVGGVKVPLKMSLDNFGSSHHRFTACVSCHTDVARSPHKSPDGAQCLACHPVHGQYETNAPHISVQCQACHNRSAFVELDKKTGVVKLARMDAKKKPISLVDHRPADLEQDKLCARCHTAGNKVGAPEAVLPARGMICFMCHTSSFSLGSWWFALALGIFLFGLIYLALFYMKGKVAGSSGNLHDKIAAGGEHLWQETFSISFWHWLKVLWFDVLWQRRLLKESVQRWFFHSLIFLAIMAKMGLGLFSWLIYELWPSSSLAMALMDKNNGFVAVANDLLGLLILIGVVLAALQRWVFKPPHVVAEWKDNIALWLLGVIIILGFVTEAARILISQVPAQTAVYSFVSYPLSRLFAGMGVNWQAAYAWLWYAHALVAAAFVAYLPFGKMRHIFTAPMSLIINRRLQ